MMSFKKRLLSRLMCFVVGLSFGAGAEAHQKNKSSSNESLTIPEWGIIVSTIILGHELILKPLAGKLYIKGKGISNETHKEYKLHQLEEYKEAYITKVLNSIDTTVDESLEDKYLKTIPNNLSKIRMALHCLFLNYSNENGENIRNTKLTIGEKIDWGFTHGGENYVGFNYVSLDDVFKILEWRRQNGNLGFYSGLTPIEKFGFVIQKWAKEMGFKSVEIVMDGVGDQYAGNYWKSSIKFKIHGFKYQLSDDERMSLMEKLGLKGIDTLEVFNDNEVIEIKCENMEDDNYGNKIIIH